MSARIMLLAALSGFLHRRCVAAHSIPILGISSLGISSDNKGPAFLLTRPHGKTCLSVLSYTTDIDRQAVGIWQSHIWLLYNQSSPPAFSNSASSLSISRTVSSALMSFICLLHDLVVSRANTSSIMTRAPTTAMALAAFNAA